MDFFWLPSNAFAPNAQGIQSIFTGNSFTAGADNADPSNSPFDQRLNQWIPFDTTLKANAIHTTVGPGVGKTENFRIHDGTNGIIGAFVQLTGTNIDVVGNHNATMPGIVVTSDGSILATRVYASAWVTASPNAVGAGYAAWQYSTPAQPDYQWFVCAVGQVVAGATFAGVPQYSSLVDTAIASTQTNQANRQFRIPKAGKLKFAYAAWLGWLNTSTVVAVLQKGTRGAAIDTAISLTMVGHPSSTGLFQGLAPSSTEVDVAAGDYVNWRIQRTAGAATTGGICLGVGYKAFTESPC